MFGRARKVESCTRDELITWLVDEIATCLRRPAADVDSSASLQDYGIDSLQAGSLLTKLERRLQRSLSPALLWDYPSIDALVDHLVPANNAAPAVAFAAEA
jgi:acyl carrier protein